MKITEPRTKDILNWLDGMTADHTLLFEEMTLFRDTAALIRQLQAAEQAAWHAGLDAGREQGGGDEHRRAERLAEALRKAKEAMLSQVKWVACDCGCERDKPAGAVSVTWLRASALLRDPEEGKRWT